MPVIPNLFGDKPNEATTVIPDLFEDSAVIPELFDERKEFSIAETIEKVRKTPVGGFLLDFLPTPKKPSKLFSEKQAKSIERSSDIFLQNLADTASFGLGGFALKKAGFKKLQPKTPEEKIMAGAGNLTGFVQGPVKFGFGLAKKLPLLGKVFGPAKTIPGILAKQATRGALGLGLAQASIAPEDDLIGLQQRAEAFKEGAKTGAIFGGISFVPHKLTRILASSSFIGIPSALRGDSLEEQVFNFGLGAYFGLRGGSPKAQLAKEIDVAKALAKGYPEKVTKRFLDENDQILAQEKRHINTIGIDPINKEQRFKDILSRGYKKDPLTSFGEKLQSKAGKVLVEKTRNNKINQAWGKIKTIKADPQRRLYEGEIDFLLNNVTSRKDIANLNNSQVVALNELLKPENLPSIDNIIKSQPLSQARGINIWDATLRPGYKFLKKLGFGGKQSEGLTQAFYEGDVTQAKWLQQFYKLKSNWINSVGTTKGSAKNIFKYLDGKLHVNLLTPKELRVASQVKEYLNLSLEAQNRQRVSWGEKPVEAKENYITHIFDKTIEAAQKAKHPFPDQVINAMEFILPKEKISPFLKKRVGARGYKQNIWDALDAYSYATSGVVADTPIRKANKIIRYMDAEIKQADRLGARSLYRLPEVKSNLKRYVEDYVGRPRIFDKIIDNTLKSVNRHLPEAMQITTVMRLNDLLISGTYGTKMGYRPKLAFRNLGQHSLILGEVGIKPLAKALRKYRTLPIGKLTPEAQQLLLESKVMQSRQRAFAPETITMGGTSEVLRREVTRSLELYRGADRINVENSYLAGYTEAQLKGKSHIESVKRGDAVAAKTQFLYLRGNRSHVARSLLGISRTAGRYAGIFSTWAPNWLELQLSWARTEHREQLLRYVGTNAVAAGLLGSLGIAFWEYTGINSVPNLIRKVRQLATPVMGAPAGRGVDPLSVGLINDIEKATENEDIRDLFLYTWHWDK